MWTGIKINSAPAVEPVSVAELKENLRLDCDTQDAMLGSLIKAARIAVETKLHRTLIETEYIQFHADFANPIELYRPPALSITSIQYYSDDSLITLPTDDYYFNPHSAPAQIVAKSAFPLVDNIPNAVQITFKAGYGADPSDVPEPIRQAIIMLASDLFEHPEANVEVKLYENITLRFLLASFEFPHFGGNS